MLKVTLNSKQLILCTYGISENELQVKLDTGGSSYTEFTELIVQLILRIILYICLFDNDLFYSLCDILQYFHIILMVYIVARFSDSVFFTCLVLYEIALFKTYILTLVVLSVT